MIIKSDQKIINILVTFDRIKKNKKIKKILLNKYKNYPPHLSNVIIVLGGDGFMLQTLKIKK